MTDINQLYAQTIADRQIWLHKHEDVMTKEEWTKFTMCCIDILSAERKINELYKTVKGRVGE